MPPPQQQQSPAGDAQPVAAPLVVPLLTRKDEQQQVEEEGEEETAAAPRHLLLKPTLPFSDRFLPSPHAEEGLEVFGLVVVVLLPLPPPPLLKSRQPEEGAKSVFEKRPPLPSLLLEIRLLITRCLGVPLLLLFVGFFYPISLRLLLPPLCG